MCKLKKMVAWRDGRSLEKRAYLSGVGQKNSMVWQAQGNDNECMVIDCLRIPLRNGTVKNTMLSCHVVHRPFKTVVADIKRNLTRALKREGVKDDA